MEITSDALVKAVLTEEQCELYDKVRIEKLFKNLGKGFGRLVIYSDHISITVSGNKSKKLTYNIPKILLTEEQLKIT